MGISAASHRLLPGVNQLLLTGKEWPGGDGKGRLSSEGLAAFPGFATSSLEYPWPAHFTSVCLSLSGAAGAVPLCSVSAGCLAHLILPDPSRSTGKGDSPLFDLFSEAGSSLPREFRRQGMLLHGSMYKYSVSANTGPSFSLLWVWDVRGIGGIWPIGFPARLNSKVS